MPILDGAAHTRTTHNTVGGSSDRRAIDECDARQYLVGVSYWGSILIVFSGYGLLGKLQGRSSPIWW